MDPHGPGIDGRGLCRGEVRFIPAGSECRRIALRSTDDRPFSLVGSCAGCTGRNRECERHCQTLSTGSRASSGTWAPGRVSKDAVTLAVLLAAVGVGMAVYLIVIR